MHHPQIRAAQAIATVTGVPDSITHLTDGLLVDFGGLKIALPGVTALPSGLLQLEIGLSNGVWSPTTRIACIVETPALRPTSPLVVPVARHAVAAHAIHPTVQMNVQSDPASQAVDSSSTGSDNRAGTMTSTVAGSGFSSPARQHAEPPQRDMTHMGAGVRARPPGGVRSYNPTPTPTGASNSQSISAAEPNVAPDDRSVSIASSNTPAAENRPAPDRPASNGFAGLRPAATRPSNGSRPGAAPASAGARPPVPISARPAFDPHDTSITDVNF